MVSKKKRNFKKKIKQKNNFYNSFLFFKFQVSENIKIKLIDFVQKNKIKKV
jgi:hypothetical protein